MDISYFNSERTIYDNAPLWLLFDFTMKNFEFCSQCYILFYVFDPLTIDCAGCVTGRMLRTRGIFCSIAPYILNWGNTIEWILLVYQIYLIWKISTSLRSTCCLHLNWGKGWFGGGLGNRVECQNSIYCFCFCYLLLIIFFSFCLYLGYTVFYLRFPF